MREKSEKRILAKRKRSHPFYDPINSVCVFPYTAKVIPF